MYPALSVVPASLNHNANNLIELAGLLEAGRPDAEISRRAVEPAVLPEVGALVRSFADFACDQYQDLVAILAALSTKLKTAAAQYGATDAGTAQVIDTFLLDSTYVPPSER